MKIDYSRNDLLTEQGRKLLEDYYCREGEDPQQAYARAARAFCGGDYELAQRIYDYASKQWFMYSSPVLSNAPAPSDGKINGLPISCFLTYVGDTLESLIEHNEEVAWLSVKGGGVGGHWSDVRGISPKAPGPIPFMTVVDRQMTAYKQGKTRKGSYAAYMDVSHPDILEFVNFKLPSGGDTNRKCYNLFNAVNLSDAFMEAVEANEPWDLIGPEDGKVRETVNARELYQHILNVRYKTGSPYLNFIDAANRALPEALKKRGLKIHGSNLCNEIHLPTDDQRTAVCCLSSVNLEKYDEWKDTNMVADLIRFLDNVLQFFIDHAPDELKKAKYSASRERSLGLGAMGFHGYLQSKGVPFESVSAMLINKEMFKRIKEQAVESTIQLAKERGEAPDMEGTGRRNAHLLAVAPNANSSIICNCSPSIEPYKSNAFKHKTRAGTHLIKNKYLEKILAQRGYNDVYTWNSIINREGSVQHLNCLTEEEKLTYKTAFEIDQGWVGDHAADRQVHICQGQSVNLFFPAGSPASYVNSVHLRAWKRGLKGLYYLRSSATVKADKIGLQVERNALKDSEECLSCQG